MFALTVHVITVRAADGWRLLLYPVAVQQCQHQQWLLIFCSTLSEDPNKIYYCCCTLMRYSSKMRSQEIKVLGDKGIIKLLCRDKEWLLTAAMKLALDDVICTLSSEKHLH